MHRIILSLLLICSVLGSKSQTVTGSWYGKADVNTGTSTNNYLIEIVLRQKGDEVEGIFGYYFKDSYQSFFIRGTFDKQSREVHVKNLPVLHNQANTRNGIECPMNFLGVLMVAQAGSTLNGYFYSDDKYKYTCPELRVVMKIDPAATDPEIALANASTGKKFWKPQEQDYIVSNPDANANAIVQTAGPANSGVVTPYIPNKNTEKKLIEKFEKRTNIFSKDLEIEGDSVRISFYDNGDIDGDSISVFLNKSPVLVREGITERALNIYLAMDSSKEVNEISMLAENLGKYPPNTALMIVTDGINRYEVYLSSSLTQNATVRLKRKKVEARLKQ